MTATTATPVAPHVNFFALAILNSTKNPLGLLGPASERRRRKDIAPGHADDREGAVNRAQDLVVLVKRCIGDIHDVASPDPELLRDEDRYWWVEVLPKTTDLGLGTVQQIPHSKHLSGCLVS